MNTKPYEITMILSGDTFTRHLTEEQVEFLKDPNCGCKVELIKLITEESKEHQS